ncbi:CMRF35-like molecule 8 isoform X3 [Alosa sapidissima]|uniref:CMRF35-like molecule 8 isoform X3 n=1 Tax=Alosa sapidissima TaxID=34773 RepID=UPI001C087A74|nr:CMRF35-like molecule 8 isoform X3 [Alosa sapidissima]
MSMCDDVTNSIFTMTVRMDVGVQYTNVNVKKYNCGVIGGGPDNEKVFTLLDTEDIPKLRVQNQTVFGYEGETVVVECLYRNLTGEKKWCRIDGSCLKVGEVDGMLVETADAAGVFKVTLRNLQEKNSGWYWCSVGESQMPVHITVSKRPIHHTTITPTLQTTPQTTMSNNSSADIGGTTKNPNKEQTELIIYCLLGVTLLSVSTIVWFILKKHKNKKGHGRDRKSNLEAGDDVTYSHVSHQNRNMGKSPRYPVADDVTYSAVAQRHIQAGDDVTYSHVSHQNRSKGKSPRYPVADDVTYSAVAQRHIQAGDDVTYSHVSHQNRNIRKSLMYPVADDVTYSAVAQRHVQL